MDKKIQQIAMFIELDAAQTEIEMDNMANDEYRNLVDQMVADEKRKINAIYMKMERSLIKNNILIEATLKNTSRLTVSRLKHEILEEVFDYSREKLVDEVNRKKNYRDVMKKLALQSLAKVRVIMVLCSMSTTSINLQEERSARDKKLLMHRTPQLVAPKVLFRVMKTDYTLIKGMIDELVKEFKAMSRSPAVNIRIDEKNFLPDSEIGGVVVYSTTGEMKVVNTLRYRLELIHEKMLPVVRFFVFGPNPVRNFYE